MVLLGAGVAVPVPAILDGAVSVTVVTATVVVVGLLCGVNAPTERNLAIRRHPARTHHSFGALTLAVVIPRGEWTSRDVVTGILLAGGLDVAGWLAVDRYVLDLDGSDQSAD